MLKQRFALAMLWVAVSSVPLLAQVRGQSMTLHYAVLSPLIALLAGILILFVPRILNYVVAVYLILIGLIGLLGQYGR